MIIINMQYFGGRSASSGKSGGAAGGRAQSQEKQLIKDFDSASTEQKIELLRQHEGSNLGTDEGSEELWNHAYESAKPIEISSRSSKGEYFKANKEYVKDNKMPSQNDSVGPDRLSIIRGSKGNMYIYKYSPTKSKAKLARGEYIDVTVRQLPWK